MYLLATLIALALGGCILVVTILSVIILVANLASGFARWILGIIGI